MLLKALRSAPQSGGLIKENPPKTPTDGLVKHFADFCFKPTLRGAFSQNHPRRVSLNILPIWALRHILKILIFQSKKICVFFLQLILEYIRKLVLVPRCPFSDLSSEGLVEETSQTRPRRVSINISLCLKRGAAHARYALENSSFFNDKILRFSFNN